MASFSKVTCLDSDSGAPTPPHPTPATDSQSQINDNPVTDLSAVDKTLGPIQEELNDAAEEAMYPTPPINSPAFSPAPSVIVRQGQRNRGMSTIGDRLAELTMGDYGSNRSDVCSMDGEVEGGGVSIPTAMGSLSSNPLFHQYMAARAPAGGGPPASRDSEKAKDGVTENRNWAEEVMDDLERALMRLEQLADDEGAASKNLMEASDYYREHLAKALDANDRKYKVALKKY